MKFTLFDKVTKLCERKGVSLYKMCKDVGVTYPIVINWKKRDNAEPSLRVAVALADYFGVDVRDFITD